MTPILRASFMMMGLLLAFVGAGLSPIYAQGTDAEGTGDHPLLPRAAGSYIHDARSLEFASVELPAGPTSREGTPKKTVEGAHDRLVYRFDDPETSLLRLYRSYLRNLEDRRYEIVFTGTGSEFAAQSFGFLTQNRVISDCDCPLNGETHYILARSEAENATIALTFHGRATVGQGRPPVMVANVVVEEDPGDADLFFVAAPEPKDAETLESSLIADGRVVVDAILFDFGKADILPDSATALSIVADLLAQRPELRLMVVGHTDAVGGFDSNLKLSLDRAVAVVSWLRDRHGVSAERLLPAGAGPMSPVTTNRTDEGRARNRRVELVEIAG